MKPECELKQMYQNVFRLLSYLIFSRPTPKHKIRSESIFFQFAVCIVSLHFYLSTEIKCFLYVVTALKEIKIIFS